MNEKIYPDDYSIFKPNAQGTGGALALSFSPRGIFLKIARQLGTQRMFDWKPATVIALNLTDISKILAGQQGKKEVSLFHDAAKSTMATSNAQKGLKITFNEQYGNFFWELWRKEGEVTTKASVPVTPEETIIIDVLLRWATPLLLKWHIVDTSSEPSRPQEVPQPAAYAPDEPAQAPLPAGFDNIFPGAESVSPTPDTREQKLVKIMALAKSKLGATSAEEAKTKVMEFTNLAFIDANLDQILSTLLLNTIKP